MLTVFNEMDRPYQSDRVKTIILDGEDLACLNEDGRMLSYFKGYSWTHFVTAEPVDFHIIGEEENEPKPSSNVIPINPST